MSESQEAENQAALHSEFMRAWRLADSVAELQQAASQIEAVIRLLSHVALIQPREEKALSDLAMAAALQVKGSVSRIVRGMGLISSGGAHG